MDGKMPRMRTIPEAAKETGGVISAYCLRKMVKRGEIPYIMSGRKVLLNLDALLRIMETGIVPERESHDRG